MKALHKAGIEVLLDLVYNHTNEGASCPSLALQVVQSAALGACTCTAGQLLALPATFVSAAPPCMQVAARELHAPLYHRNLHTSWPWLAGWSQLAQNSISQHVQHVSSADCTLVRRWG